MNSPVRHTRPGYVVTQRHGGNFSVDSAAYLQMIARRKSFRTRGSLGPTVASAPSVEQEDYRTPKPSVCSIKNGKSFDFGGHECASSASDSNGLIKLAENSPDGFQDGEEQPSESHEDSDTIWQRLQEEHLVDGVSLADYLAIDENVVTGGTQTLAEITEGVSLTDMVESDSEVVEEEQELPQVTAREATEALRIVQRYVETNTAYPEVQQMCDKLEDFLAADHLKKLKQKNILDYFLPSV